MQLTHRHFGIFRYLGNFKGPKIVASLLPFVFGYLQCRLCFRDWLPFWYHMNWWNITNSNRLISTITCWFRHHNHSLFNHIVTRDEKRILRKQMRAVVWCLVTPTPNTFLHQSWHHSRVWWRALSVVHQSSFLQMKLLLLSCTRQKLTKYTESCKKSSRHCWIGRVLCF